MINEDDKKFIANVLINFASDLRDILTDYSCFIERMYDAQNERLDEIVTSLDVLTESITDFTVKD